MKDVEGTDHSKHRARTGRREDSVDRPRSSHRSHPQDEDSRAREHRSTRSEHSSHRHHRHHTRDRSKERHRRRSRERKSSPSHKEDLIPRYREKTEKEGPAETKPTKHSRSGSRGRKHHRERDNSESPPTSKRPRSRSLSSQPVNTKKHRKAQGSPGGEPLSNSRDRSTKKHSRVTSRTHHRSASRQSHSRRTPVPVGSPHDRQLRRRSSSRSPPRSDTGSRRSAQAQQSSHRPRNYYNSRSPSPHSQRFQGPSRSGRWERHHAANSLVEDSVGRSSAGPSRSPIHNARSGHSRHQRSPDDRYSSHPDFQDDMVFRGGYRGDYPPSYAYKSQYPNDSHSHSQSPQYGGGSYHASPNDSPRGSGRPRWTRPAYSPPHPYPPQPPPSYHHPPSDYGPPHPPPPHYYHNPPHSPPHGPPTGPMQHHFPPDGYRGGHRGGGFRGGAFGGRGGSRGGGFQTTQRILSNPSLPRAPSSVEDRGSRNPSESKLPSRLEEDPAPPESRTDSSKASTTNETTIAQPSKLVSIDSAQPRKGIAPPTGPSTKSNTSSKFSFAFKTSSKISTTAPKPEISQKFNVAPPRRDAPAKTDENHEPPSSAPTEPASTRNREEHRDPPSGPRIAPRTRKVRKLMKRPKARPELSSDLIESESVYFRKPGNESVIGSGTYGKVFKGLNVYTKGLVALKRIRMEGERDGFPVTAVREIKLLQSLRHKNIVNLQEVMVEKNDCFMVFEYLSYDLTGLLNHPTFKLDHAQRKDLSQQLFQGLDYLHKRGVLHRDIKAANILVSNEGILKLADFGLARFYAKHHQLDYTNRVITIWYRSPELLLGETRYNASVDVWSAACVMVEIFSRYAIFAGDGSELSQLDKIYNVLGTPNRQDWPGLADMAWFELLRPNFKRKSTFAEKYGSKMTPAAFELLSAMFNYDPTKRPTAAEVLQHAYFTSEEPAARQAVELSKIAEDWHEHESKALRKENERRDREARKVKDEARDKEKKRPMEGTDSQRDPKRVQLDERPRAEQSNKPAKKEVANGVE